MDRTNLTGLNIHELVDFSTSLDENPFRGKQLFNWIYARKAISFHEMTNLSRELRQKLSDSAELGQLTLEEKAISPNSGSIKYLFRLTDNQVIEAVFIPESGRRTLCISSQVGCALKCAFCATGTLGLKRNLSAGEIVDQVLFAERDTGQEMSNIVFMGMGEPFKNYDNVIKACNLINHQDGIAIGYRRIVISTVGIVPAIYQYADDGHRFRLAISLHSVINEKRKSLMPVSAKYTVEKLIEAVRYYIQKAGERPTFEYILLAGVNDQKEDAEALKKIIRQVPCKVNLIPYNPVLDRFQRPSNDQVDQFAGWLLPVHAPVSVRWSKGDDIEAACGQLAGRHIAEAENRFQD